VGINILGDYISNIINMEIKINEKGYLEGRYKELIQIWPPNYPIEKLKLNLKYSYEQHHK